jgi:tripartite-type tricarboxylate transporter receptor subunit TctC
MMKKVLTLLAILPIVAACGGGGQTSNSSGSGEAFPANCQSINLIVGFSAGGVTDLTFRAVADQFAKQLDTDVQVINAAGGGGSVAVNQLKAAPHDGCTIGNANIPTQLQYLYPEVEAGYTKEDFAFAGAFGIGPQALAVAANSPYKTLDDLIKAGKEKGSLTAVVDAPKGSDSIINAQFAKAAGITVRQVVVDGSSEKVTALLGGQVDFTDGGLGGLLPSVQSGQLRALTVWSPERSDSVPDVQTAKDQGIDVVQETLFGLLMPANVPDAARQKLEDTLKTTTENTDFQKQMKDLGIPVAFMTGKQFSEAWDDMADTVKGINFESLS